MNPQRIPAAFPAGYNRPITNGEEREEQNVVPDQNRGLRSSQDDTEILTQIGHFHT